MFGSGTNPRLRAHQNKPFLTKLLVKFSNVNIPLFAFVVSVKNTKISIIIS
jgi:hypothetical protein